MIYEKTVLVTGGAGFIGSALLRYLVPKYPQYMFINVDDLREGSNANSIITLADSPNYAMLAFSLERDNTYTYISDKYNITDILHLAAETDVDRSIKDPIRTVQNNVLSTLKLLEFARSQKTFNKFVYISTDEVYGQVGYDDVSKTEKDSQNPGNQYSASKCGAEALVMAYKKTYGLNTVITRGANTFGKYQDYTKLIPVAMRALRDGHKIPLYGDGKQMREWLPVDMHCEGIEIAWLQGTQNIYNISTGISFTNLELIKILIDAVNAPKDSFEFVADRLGHDLRYAISNLEITMLGFGQTPFRLTEEYVKEKLVETARWFYPQYLVDHPN